MWAKLKLACWVIRWPDYLLYVRTLLFMMETKICSANANANNNNIFIITIIIVIISIIIATVFNVTMAIIEILNSHNIVKWNWLQATLVIKAICLCGAEFQLGNFHDAVLKIPILNKLWQMTMTHVIVLDTQLSKSWLRPWLSENNSDCYCVSIANAGLEIKWFFFREPHCIFKTLPKGVVYRNMYIIWLPAEIWGSRRRI